MRVARLARKAYSEYMVARASQCHFRIPDHVSFDEGAAYPIQTLTAWHILLYPRITLGLARPWWCIRRAASVGNRRGANRQGRGSARDREPISRCSSAALAKEYGADEVIDYVAKDFSAEVMRITENHGAQLILDAVGKPTFEKGLNCLAPMGHLVLYGRAGGPPDPLNVFKLFARSTKVSGFMLNQQHTGKEQWQRGLEDSFKLMKDGKLKLLIGKKYRSDRSAGGASLHGIARLNRQAGSSTVGP